MRRALSGESGTVVGLDYRGEKVLAAYEQIGILDWGVVGKIDLAEVRGVFVRTGVAASSIGVVVILAGALTFLRSTDPLIRRLESNEARTRAILDTAGEGVITIDERGVIESLNAAAERIFGYAAAEAIGKNVTVLMPERHRERHTASLARYLRTGESRLLGETVELEGKRLDGSTFPLEATVSEVRWPGNRAFTGIVRDITERKRLQEDLSRKHADLAEAQRVARLGSWTWNIVTNELRWSDEVYRIFGVQPQEFGATYDAFLKSVHPDDRETVKAAVDKALADQNVIYGIEHRIVRPNGSERVVHERGAVVLDDRDRPIRMVGTVHDVTERRRLEEEILNISRREQRRIGQDLHDVVGQRLTGIAFLLWALQRKLGERALPEAATAAEIASMVNETITEARALAKGLCPVDLTADGLMTALQEQAAHIEELFDIVCTFRCDRPVLVHDDAVATQLYRIAQEAVNNSTRHSKAQRIEIAIVQDNERRVTLTVRDDGLGLPDDLDHTKGMGLRIMNYRARMIGATHDVKQGPDGGTVVACSFRSNNATGRGDQS
jgi:PAS domain S-box-containing protein